MNEFLESFDGMNEIRKDYLVDTSHQLSAMIDTNVSHFTVADAINILHTTNTT